jgi:hypothetical protein
VQEDTEASEAFPEYHVATEFRDALDELQGDYAIQPFPLFDENNVKVNPDKIARIMPGCLVEVHFQLRHIFIKGRGGDNDSDTFTGRLIQAKIVDRAKVQSKIASAAFDEREFELLMHVTIFSRHFQLFQLLPPQYLDRSLVLLPLLLLPLPPPVPAPAPMMMPHPIPRHLLGEVIPTNSPTKGCMTMRKKEREMETMVKSRAVQRRLIRKLVDEQRSMFRRFAHFSCLPSFALLFSLQNRYY